MTLLFPIAWTAAALSVVAVVAYTVVQTSKQREKGTRQALRLEAEARLVRYRPVSPACGS